MNYLFISRLIIVSILIGIAIVLQTHTIISGDITWLMQVGERFIAGGHYYKNFVEVNPPMAIYLYLIPVILSNSLHISFITSVTVYIFCATLLAWLACCYLFKKMFAPTDIMIRYLFEIILAFIFFILPTYALGQREHFLVMLMLPYLLLVVLRLQQQPVTQLNAILIGVAAGIGFAIKPFFLLAWLLIELYMILRAQSLKFALRTETLSCLGIGIIYFISIFLLTPEYIAQTVTLIKPIYYFNFRAPLSLLISNSLIIYSVIILIIYWLNRKRFSYQILGDLLAISTISMLVNFFTQQTLWFYHILPVLSFATLLLTLVTLNYIKINNLFKSSVINLHFFSRLINIFVLVILLSYVLFVTFINIKVSFYLTKALFNNPIYSIAKSANGRPIYIFTNNIATNYPLLDYSQTYSPSSFPCLWLITAAHKLETSDKSLKNQQLATQIANFVRTKDINNMITHKPLFILVQKKNDFLAIHKNFLFASSYIIEQLPAFDFITFFLQDQHFARFWQNYQYKGQSGVFSVYELKQA